MPFRISNTEGRSDRAWSLTYETKLEAAHAIRDAMSWDAVELSESYETGTGPGWSAYPDEASRDEDETGAYAPRIEEYQTDEL